MRCSECHLAINFWGEDWTVTVVYRDGRTEKHCHHHPFVESDPEVVAILGSDSCLKRWQQRRNQFSAVSTSVN